MVTVPATTGESDNIAPKTDPTEIYQRLTRMIERLHRRHLDMLRYELDKLGVEDINAAQVLMLTKIQGHTISVRDLVERGYYLGSNASYNIKQMVKSGLVEQERSTHDRRSIRVRLTEAGEDLCRKVADAEKRHADVLSGEAGSREDVDLACTVLKNLESTWSNYLRYGEF